MASVLLDSLINDTIRPLGGASLLEAAPTLQTPPADSLQIPTLAANEQRSALDHLDASMGSLMQDVEMGQRERLFWIIIFALMVLVAAGGNTMVIYIVSTNREMKSVTNYFLVNLSLADTMVSTLNVIFNFISMLNR